MAATPASALPPPMDQLRLTPGGFRAWAAPDPKWRWISAGLCAVLTAGCLLSLRSQFLVPLGVALVTCGSLTAFVWRVGYFLDFSADTGVFVITDVRGLDPAAKYQGAVDEFREAVLHTEAGRAGLLLYWNDPDTAPLTIVTAGGDLVDHVVPTLRSAGLNVTTDSTA